MPSTADFKEVPIPRILIVGDSGTHKTWFVGTIPEVFIFDFDKGLSILRHKDVEYETFKDAPRQGRKNEKEGIYQFGTAWPKFISKLNIIGTKIDKGEWNRPIAFDSLTTMATCAMSYVLDNAGHKGNPQIQHWGAQIQLLEMVFDQLSAWPVPIIVTAHIQRNTNDLTQLNEMLPLVTGKLAGKIGLYFDEVYYTKVNGKGKDKKFVLQTESDMLFKQAKSRYGVTDGIETDWNKVFNEMMENK